MSKSCSICSEPQGVQDKVLELYRMNKSQREIESSLYDLFNLKISHTAIGRHLKHCIDNGGVKEEGVEDSEINLLGDNDAPPENTELHHDLCKVLTNSARIFSKRIRETASSTVPYGAHLDSIKALDTLVNVFDKLYQNPKEGRTHDQKRADLSDLQLKIIHDVMTTPEKDNPDVLKNTILDVFERHQSLVENKDDSNTPE